ncbi:helix-turn-helix domain-containing protein [Leuconostoc pseudomesenteroides]
MGNCLKSTIKDLQLISSSLSAHERSVIETMIQLNHSIREIARFLKRSSATITYELNRIKPYCSEVNKLDYFSTRSQVFQCI